MPPAYLDRGNGDTALVFLHGIGGGKEIWRPQLDYFSARNWRCVSWDMPGYGASPMPSTYRFDILAESLLRLIDRLHAARVVLVGHSVGGMLAMETYAAAPERFAGLVLSCTSAAFGKADGAWQQAFVEARLAPLDAGKTMRELAPELIAHMVGTNADPAGVALAHQVMSAVTEATYRHALGCLMGFDRRALLPQIALPTLVLAAERDQTAPATMMQRMAANIAGSRFVVVPDGGHIVNVEQPAAFNAAVENFLAGLPD